jgi:hypothetical protein
MAIEIDEDVLYFFTYFKDNVYKNALLGFITKDLIEPFKLLKPGKGYAHIHAFVGENQFNLNVGVPLYLIDYNCEEAYEFASDDDQLDLYPSGNVPEGQGEDRLLYYPTYFNKGVEPFLRYKMFDKFYMKEQGEWIRIKV